MKENCTKSASAPWLTATVPEVLADRNRLSKLMWKPVSVAAAMKESVPVNPGPGV